MILLSPLVQHLRKDGLARQIHPPILPPPIWSRRVLTGRGLFTTRRHQCIKNRKNRRFPRSRRLQMRTIGSGALTRIADMVNGAWEKCSRCPGDLPVAPVHCELPPFKRFSELDLYPAVSSFPLIRDQRREQQRAPIPKDEEERAAQKVWREGVYRLKRQAAGVCNPHGLALVTRVQCERCREARRQYRLRQRAAAQTSIQKKREA